MLGLLALAMVVAQTTHSFVLMLIPYVLAALGSAALHPVGAMHASECEPHRSTVNTSIFFLMGQLGISIGPALAGFLLDRYATHNTLFVSALGPTLVEPLIERATVAPLLALVVIGIPVTLFIASTLPTARAHVEQRLALAKAATEATRRSTWERRAIVLFVVVVALRSLINPASGSFIPRLFQSQGWDATAYGLATSAFWLGGGISGVIIGNLTHRFDSRYLVAGTLILAAPALFALTVLDGAAAFVMALVVGALSGGSHSLLVVQAQSMLPGRKGLASGAILGFMFTTGALGTLLIGALADRIGLPSAYHIVAAITVGTGLLGLALPIDRRRPAPVSGPATSPAVSATSAD
jgi:FSR family fosmidomycin resistance protein-like MFS transporter